MHIHKYEKYWLAFGIASLVIFLSITGVMAFSHGHQPPSGMMNIDPEKVEETPPFDKPGLVKTGENTYDANLIAMTFGFKPNTLQIPLGAKVKFQVASRDVVHSFTIVGTNVNMMVTPGNINVREYTFNKPGKYLVVCNEYCGTGHQLMSMTIEVTEK